MKKLFTVLAISSMLITMSSSALRSEVMPMDTFGLTHTWSLGIGVNTFQPNEKEFDQQNTLVNGTLRYFASNLVSLELAYGSWTNSYAGTDAGKAIIRPLTFGVNWYPWQTIHEGEDRVGQNVSLFTLSAGVGSYDFDWSRTTKVANGDYNDRETGFYVGAGYEYYFTQNLSGLLQVRAHNCDLRDARPTTINSVTVTDRNIDLTNVSFGGALMWTFR